MGRGRRSGVRPCSGPGAQAGEDGGHRPRGEKGVRQGTVLWVKLILYSLVVYLYIALHVL